MAKYDKHLEWLEEREAKILEEYKADNMKLFEQK